MISPFIERSINSTVFTGTGYGQLHNMTQQLPVIDVMRLGNVSGCATSCNFLITATEKLQVRA
jgi:hypothetical protein